MITPEQKTVLTELIEACAQAAFDDGSFNVGGNSVTGYDALTVLDKIAGVFELTQPSVLLDRLYDGLGDQ